LPKTAFSQHLSITEIERDSIVSKIIRGNKAIEKNKVYIKQIAVRDSVIVLHHNLQEVCQNSIVILKETNFNLNSIILHKDSMIKNEIKIGRKKRNKGLITGAGVGLLLGFLLFN